MATNNHALVFGASGTAGWAVVNQLLNRHRAFGTYSSMTALVNRPLSIEASKWDVKPGQPELQIAARMDLTSSTAEGFAAKLKSEINHVEHTTHVFYCAFKQHDDPQQECQVNRQMMRCLANALNLACPNMQAFVVCAGARYYQRQCSPSKSLPTPFTEDMIRWADPQLRKQTFYYDWEDELSLSSAGKQWTWCEIIPDAIIGFAPSGSAFSLAAMWATYLTTYALREGKGAMVPFPGTKKAYAAKYNEASATIVANEMIWAADNSEQIARGECFNVADSSKPNSMEDMWPRLAAHFGLKGIAPPDGVSSQDTKGMVMPSVYVKQHCHLLAEKGLKQPQVFKGDWLDVYGLVYEYDRQLSLDKLRKAGFTEQRDPLEGWVKTFERYKTAGMIL